MRRFTPYPREKGLPAHNKPAKCDLANSIRASKVLLDGIDQLLPEVSTALVGGGHVIREPATG